jgi:hypothetical protein
MGNRRRQHCPGFAQRLPPAEAWEKGVGEGGGGKEKLGFSDNSLSQGCNLLSSLYMIDTFLAA